ALQKHLTCHLSTTGATFVRFGYGFPVAVTYVAFLHYGMDAPWPQMHARFWGFTMAGGLSQIIATFLLVSLFSLRNFTVGTAYSKTEPLQAAIFGAIILGDVTSTGATLAILIGLVGVVVISVAHAPRTAGGIVASLLGRSALIGLASGTCFGLAAVMYRAASLSIAGDSPGINAQDIEAPGFLMQAGFTLLCVTGFQSVIMAVYLRLREPGQLTAVMGQWRMAALVGISGVVASMGWFTAMTIQSVAYVRALGQIELIFTFVASYFFFHEKISRTEVVGVILIAACIVILLMDRA
ncbi:MAG: DMT family transporter, partial [Rhodospirillales bacterium]|nr:DMT family transporter [Rhodospirillales bacterium]